MWKTNIAITDGVATIKRQHNTKATAMNGQELLGDASTLVDRRGDSTMLWGKRKREDTEKCVTCSTCITDIRKESYLYFAVLYYYFS